MALALDGSGNANHSFGAGTTLTFSLTTTSSPDRIIVGVFAFWVGSVPSISVSGSTIGSFTARGTQINDGAGNHYFLEFFKDAASTLSSETITVTITGSNSNYFITTAGFGISGASSYAFDANAALPGTSTTAGTNATVTTSNANDFIYAFIVDQSGSGSAGSGWTSIFSGNFLNVEYQVVSATQSALACTLGNDSTQIALGDAVQAAGGVAFIAKNIEIMQAVKRGAYI
jgi:hypothetical protein